MAHGATSDVGLGDLMHLDGAHHAAVKAGLFDRVLEGDSVDHGGQHAHVIGGNAIHADGLLGNTAEEVPAPDDDADLTADTGDFGELLGDRPDENGINAEATAGGQGFT